MQRDIMGRRGAHAEGYMQSDTCRVAHAEGHMQRDTCRGTYAEGHMQKDTCRGTHAEGHMQRDTCRGKQRDNVASLSLTHVLVYVDFSKQALDTISDHALYVLRLREARIFEKLQNLFYHL